MTWLGTSLRTAFQVSWVVSSLFTSIHSSMFSTRNFWRCSATSPARPSSLISSITSSGRHSRKVMLGQDAQRAILEHHPKAALLSIGSPCSSRIFSASLAKGKKSSCKHIQNPVC